MHRILPHLLAMGTAIGLIAAALAQDLPGNIASGRHIAESWCTRCHQINLDSSAPLPAELRGDCEYAVYNCAGDQCVPSHES